MNLEKCVEFGWLKREPTSAQEIQGLRSIVDRSLEDANVAMISTGLRFIAAFTAALTSATIALRACGYRTSAAGGHHIKTIESLDLTLAPGSNVIRKLKTFNNKRNRSSYDVAGAVSDQELAALIDFAEQLSRDVRHWLQRHYPDLAG